MKADSRVKLTNEISKLIIKTSKDFNETRQMVKLFDSFLNDTIRNFYEIKMWDYTPLFTLCEYLELGADNYGLTPEEFQEEIDRLTKLKIEMFNEK